MHGVVLAMSKYCSTMSGCLSILPFPSTSTTRVNLSYNPSMKPGFQFQLLPSEEGCESFRNLKCNVDGTEAGIDGFIGICFLLCSVTCICYWEKTKDIPNEARLPPGTTLLMYRLLVYDSHINECRDSTLKLETRFSFYILLSYLLNNCFTYVV